MHINKTWHAVMTDEKLEDFSPAPVHVQMTWCHDIQYPDIASTIDNREEKQFHDQIHNRGGDINLDSISTQADSWQLQRERAWQLTVTVAAIMSPVKIESRWIIIKDTHSVNSSVSHKVLIRCSVLVWQYIGVTPGPWPLSADCWLLSVSSPQLSH